MRATPRTSQGQLLVDPRSGLLLGADFVASPNCDDRPEGCQPELVVIHGISLPPGEFGGPWIERLFTNSLPATAHPYFATIEGLRVSAHALIRRDGCIIQFVPFDRRAWHAGESSWRGRARCNDYSVGIELEGTDGTSYEDAQYSSLAMLLVALIDAYPGLSEETVAGHSDVAPGRKTDPGLAFDWARLRALLRLGLELPRDGAPR
jgi:AmpD protein